MDALRHADEILAAVWRLHPEFALPGHVGSPMDDRATLVIPRSIIEACEPGAAIDESAVADAIGAVANGAVTNGPLPDPSRQVLVDQEMRRGAEGISRPSPLRDTA